jgi:hypothetical protein
LRGAVWQGGGKLAPYLEPRHRGWPLVPKDS